MFENGILNIDVGRGYRQLQVNEVRVEGDQYIWHDEWEDCTETTLGKKVKVGDLPCRRKVED